MKNKIRSLITHPFVKGSFIFTISNFIISLLNYFFNFLVGRTLGPSSYGEVTAFFSYITIFSIPFTIISTLIIQKISSTNLDHYAYSKSLEGWFITKIKKWWFLFIMFIFITPFIPKLTNISPITGYLIIASVIIAPFSIFYISALQGLKLFLIVAVINVITAFIKFLGSFLVSLHIDGLLTVMSFLMFSTVFNLIAVFFSFNKYVKPEKLDYKIGKRIRDAVFNRYFVLTTASIISIILLTNVDIIFSKKYFTATEAGFFAAWSLFAKIIYYLIGPFVTLAFIFFSSDKDSKDQDRILIGTLGVLTIVSFLCLILYSFFPAVVEMIFGSKFKYIVNFLPLAAIFGFFYSAINLFNNYFLAKKSLFTLILPLSFPLYILTLLLYCRSLEKIMKVDIVFGLLITFIYLCAYFYKKKFNRLYIISS